MIKVLLFAPANEILGGQTVQGVRMMQILGATPGLDMRFQAINPAFPPGLGWVKRVPVLRTVLTMLLYLPQVLWKAWQVDILHIFSAGLYSYTLWSIPAMLIGRLYGKQVILNYRDGQGEQHLQQFRSAKPTMKLAHAIVSPSGFIVDVFRQYGIPARTIFNIIDSGKFLDRRRSKLRPALMTNRGLEPLYNIECILRAFKRVLERYPDATLTIANDGPARQHLEQYAASLGIRNYQFIGQLPNSGMPKLLDAADIYVMTPNINCMPGSLLECMASGIPIISTNTGGVTFIVTDEKTALLVNADDDAGVAERVFRLLEDPALVERLTDEGRREVQRYRPEIVRDEWVALYRELLGRR